MPFDYVPGLAGVPAARSKIGLVDGQAGQLYYRGIPVGELAEKACFEEVAYLLLRGHLPTAAQLDELRGELTRRRRLGAATVELMRTLPAGGHPMNALIATVASAGMEAPPDLMSSEQGRWEAALDILAKVPSMVAGFHRIREGRDPVEAPDELGHAAAFLYGLTGEAPDPLAARTMDAALILHAEHGFNASTFSARVTGSTLSSPYAVISAAIGTLAGPLHGGANEDVLRTLAAIGDADPAAWAAEQIAGKKKIPGFGHRVYKVKDPRAHILQGLGARVFEKLGSTPLYDVATALEAALEQLVGHKGIYPNVDFYSGIIYQKLGVPTDLFTPIFAIARTAGWLAHWLEQLEDNRIFRPTQIYEGERDVAFTPIGDRG